MSEPRALALYEVGWAISELGALLNAQKWMADAFDSAGHAEQATALRAAEAAMLRAVCSLGDLLTDRDRAEGALEGGSAGNANGGVRDERDKATALLAAHHAKVDAFTLGLHKNGSAADDLLSASSALLLPLLGFSTILSASVVDALKAEHLVPNRDEALLDGGDHG